MARGLNVSCVMTCILRKQAGQGTLNLYGMDWTINQMSVERSMLPIGKGAKKNIESVSMLLPRGGGPRRASAHTSLGFFLHAPNIFV